MNRLERSSRNRGKLRSWLPSEGRSPEGKLTDGFYFPDCYSEAEKVITELNKLGFHIKKSGISVATEQYQIAEATAFLSGILDSDMRTTIPSYFLTLTPTKIDNSIPAYFARTLTSTQIDRQTLPDGRTKFVGSIVNEIGAPAEIVFVDEPPYCLYPKDPEKLFPIPRHIIQDGIRTKLKDPNGVPNEQNVAILAGIGKNASKVAKDIYGIGEEEFKEVRHGSAVMILAMLGMALVDWGIKNPDQSLFIICTARLTNDQDSPPSSYILNKILRKLGWKADWVGMPIIRAAMERTHPTGAVIVEIKPEQYKDELIKIRSRFNQAVKRMVSENPGLFC